MAGAGAPAEHPTFREALRYWARLGCINFGGPSGQIAIMHRELVEERRWVSEARFLHALNYCMLLPGPEAQQLATYLGWLLHRTKGGLAAGVLFLLPGLAVLLALSWVYVAWGTLPAVAGFFAGLKAAVLGIVAHAVLRLGRRAVRAPAHVAIAALAFLALLLANAPFPAIVAAAALAGYASHRWAPGLLPPPRAPGAPAEGAVLGADDPTPAHALPRRGRAARVLAWGLALWALPLGLLALLAPATPVLLDAALFFTQLALVTFGGAYAVLTYLAQASVLTHGWLTTPQMIDGLGLAETTPGPLIMVVSFVGFLAGHQAPGALSPLAAALAGGLVAAYFTFLPSFVFIFLGGPYVERLRGEARLTAALSGITAAVVGVVLHLALFFGQHVVLAEGRLAPFPALLAAASFAALLHPRVGVVAVVLAGGALGAAARLGGVA